MELQVLNSDLINIKIVENYRSLLWIDRYCGGGEFTLITSDILGTLSNLLGGVYVSISESEHIMVIEGIKIESTPDSAEILTVTGRSLEEAILDRRIVWNKLSLTGNFQSAIRKILYDNAIDCADPDRTITRLAYEESDNPVVTDLTIDTQLYGNSVYAAILDLCSSVNIGFKVVPDSDRKLVFSLYSGVDRSIGQSENPYVIFSEEFENLLSSTYTETTAHIKSMALVAGEEGIGNVRKVVEVSSGDGATDIERREVFVDASGVTRNIPDEEPLTDEEYLDQLRQKGVEELSIRMNSQLFEAQIDPTTSYVFGRDFFIGDIVHIQDSYGHEKRTQVREVIHYQDVGGVSIYPTFTAIT